MTAAEIVAAGTPEDVAQCDRYLYWSVVLKKVLNEA